MNPNEKLVAKKTARIIRAARKRIEMTQTTLASRLGTSQANISKLEKGILIPSALEWFDFCAITQISPETIRSGYLDREEAAVLRSDPFEAGHRLPHRYAQNRGSKVRALLPWLKYFESIHGEEGLERYLCERKVDPDLFVDYSNQISLNFLLDLSLQLLKEGNLKPATFARITAPVKGPEAHGRLSLNYEQIQSPRALLAELIANSAFYEINFRYQIEEQNSSKTVFSVAPESHLNKTSYRTNADLGDFLCQYKKHYFSSFSGYGMASPALLDETECHFHGADRCVYRLKTA